MDTGAFDLQETKRLNRSFLCFDIYLGFFHARKLPSKVRERPYVSTQVSARAWNNARRGTRGLPTPVKLASCHITFTVLLRRITQPILDIIIFSSFVIININHLKYMYIEMKTVHITTSSLKHHNIWRRKETEIYLNELVNV